jgi:hypothetical protein
VTVLAKASSKFTLTVEVAIKQRVHADAADWEVLKWIAQAVKA